MRMFPVFVEMGGPDVVYCTLPKPLGLWASTKVGFIVTIYSFIVHSYPLWKNYKQQTPVCWFLFMFTHSRTSENTKT